jgi:hypothetical protein
MFAQISTVLVCLSFWVTQRPIVERRPGTIKIYATDQLDYPLVWCENLNNLSVYRCSNQLFSPFFWSWVMIDTPDVWKVVLARENRQTDIIAEIISEIDSPSPEVSVLQGFNFSNERMLSRKNSIDSIRLRGGSISRCEVSSADISQFLMLMGMLGMNFENPVDGKLLAVYLLSKDFCLEEIYSTRMRPVVDLETGAFIVTFPYFQSITSKVQMNAIIEYAQEHKKVEFLGYLEKFQYLLRDEIKKVRNFGDNNTEHQENHTP